MPKTEVSACESLFEFGVATTLTQGIPEEHLWENYVMPDARDMD